tara:strand:+ start:1173 stop:1757 length:585 start_codon:yes stop_codon:yes gene_type:complete
MSSVVYWIRHEDHTDVFTQGYVGVSNNTAKRFEEHKNRPSNSHLKHAIKKYGWDNLIKTVLLVADEAYCLLMETKLRAEDKIGWNIVKGGGMPPSSLGKSFTVSEETRKKISNTKKGQRHIPEIEALVTKNLLLHGKPTRFAKGSAPWNKGLKIGKDATKHLHIKLTCPHCNKIGNLGGMKRWHMDNCKLKGIV